MARPTTKDEPFTETTAQEQVDAFIARLNAATPEQLAALEHDPTFSAAVDAVEREFLTIARTSRATLAGVLGGLGFKETTILRGLRDVDAMIAVAADKQKG